MVASVLVLIVHVTFFIIDAFSTYYDLVHVRIGNKGFGGKFVYLTVWNICLQTIYFGLCVLNDLTGDEVALNQPNQRTFLQRLRDNFHTRIAFPVGMFVVLTFWAIYAVDRELVFPKILDGLFPVWLNHVVHTWVLPFILLDKYLVYHHHPRKHVGILSACLLALVYLAWILFIAYYSNFWVYPILEVLQTHERAIFISMCLVFFATLYILGESITSFMWRKEIKAVKSQRDKRK